MDLDVVVMREVLEQLTAGHERAITEATARDDDTSVVWARASAAAYVTCLDLLDRTVEGAPVGDVT